MKRYMYRPTVRARLHRTKTNAITVYRCLSGGGKEQANVSLSRSLSLSLSSSLKCCDLVKTRGHFFIFFIFTARKQSLRRLCFHKCLSVHKGGGLPRCMLGYTPRSEADTPTPARPSRQTPPVRTAWCYTVDKRAVFMHSCWVRKFISMEPAIHLFWLDFKARLDAPACLIRDPCTQWSSDPPLVLLLYNILTVGHQPSAGHFSLSVDESAPVGCGSCHLSGMSLTLIWPLGLLVWHFTWPDWPPTFKDWF